MGNVPRGLRTHLPGYLAGLLLAVAAGAALACGGLYWEPTPENLSVGINGPSNNEAVAAGGTINCSSGASDKDHWTGNGSAGTQEDMIDADSYQWSASAGTFSNNGQGANVTWTAPNYGCDVTMTCTADDVPMGVVWPDTGSRDDDAGQSPAVKVIVILPDLDAEGVPDADEVTKGKFMQLNNDDDNNNDTPDNEETGTVQGEDDLVKITLQQVQSTSWSGTVTLNTGPAMPHLRVWTAATKGTRVNLPANYSTAELPKELWVEGYAKSAGVRDGSLILSVASPSCWDEVKFTVVALEVIELGFTGDYMISEWPSGTHIDDPDGSAPTWKESSNPNDPVCYTKNTNVTMFGKFSVAPTGLSVQDGISVSLRAKRPDKTVFAQKDAVSLVGNPIDVTQIAGTTPLEQTVRTATPSFRWEACLAGTSSWASKSVSGPHTMYWVYDTPRASPLYDLALSKGCGYQGAGTADLSTVLSHICTGMDGDINYDPGYTPHAHTLSLFGQGTGECCCHALVYEIVAESVCSSDAAPTHIWGGHSSSYLCRYTYSGWTGPSFRVLNSAHDNAPENPHFLYHVETVANGTYYDPSYGSTGLITLNETAPAHDPDPAASRQTGSGFPPASWHDTGWTCPH